MIRLITTLTLLAGCGPIETENERGMQFEALLVQNPLCVLLCNSKLDSIGGTTIGDNHQGTFSPQKHSTSTATVGAN